MGIMRIRTEEDDIHTKLMKSYKEVPDWWYAIGFVSCFALAVVAVEVWDTGVPVWSLLLAVGVTYCVYLAEWVHFCYDWASGGFSSYFVVEKGLGVDEG
jgi:fatty acid desaturase